MGGQVGTLSPYFWGVTVNNEVHVLRGENEAINGTPVRVIVWPGAMAGEDFDPIANIHYDTYSGASKTALTSEAQFVSMCKAISCTAVLQLPAEIDNASFAAEIVNYTLFNLSFHPAYWMIGNEPELWSHWKVPWKKWGYQYTGGPTPTTFAEEVLDYVAKIREVDPTTPILGLPASGCTCGSWTFAQWISGVLNVTGDKIQAVAFHEYPAGWLGTGTGSLSDFYGTLQSAAGIPARMISARAAVQSSCPGCNVTVWISELGSALSWSAYGQYAAGFSGALSIAAQMTQAMDDNLTNVDLFAAELATTNSWFNNTGYARPDYALYTQIFSHLGGDVYQVNVTGASTTIYAIATRDPHDSDRQDLLVVNANITKSISFVPQFAGSGPGAPVAVRYWNGSIHVGSGNHTTWVMPYTTDPVFQTYPGGLPTSYVLAPQSMALFESYPSGASYVRVHAAGVPAGTPWYTTLGPKYYTTTEGNLTLLLPAGSYGASPTAIPLPIGGKELTPVERLEGVIDSPVTIAGPSTNLTINFGEQWAVNVTTSPAEGGTATPVVDWWNAGEPLTLTATPADGYAFAGWSGWGPGSYNGSDRTITVAPTGRIVEKARFAVGNKVVLWESGLPAGTPWSVTIRDFTTESTSVTLPVYELLGSYGYTVSRVPGYRSLPENGGFLVTAPLSFVEVRFVPLWPAPPQFPVSFQVSGLPASTAVSITVRDATQNTLVSPLAAPLQFDLINGTYAYHVGYVAGYHPNVPLKLFTVGGGPMVVDVPFVPTVYGVSWQATGTRAGMNWSVLLDGVPSPATSAWVSASLPNGTYSYTIELPANFSATPRTGVVQVTGGAVAIGLWFDLVKFPMQFMAPDAPSTWSVRFGNVTQTSSDGASWFYAPNGSYTFDVHPPDGFYAVPSHGVVNVTGPAPAIHIQFFPSSQQPSAALVAALTAGALSTSMWIGVAVAAGYLAIRSLKRRSG